MFFSRKNSNNVSQQKMLELQNKELKSQMENIKQFAYNYQQNYEMLKSAVINFVKSLLDREFALSQIGDYQDINVLNMNVYELISFAQKNIAKQKAETSRLIIEMQRVIDDKNRQIEDLKNQLSQLLIAKNLSKQEILEIFAKPSEEKDTKIQSNDVIPPAKQPNNIIEIQDIPIVKIINKDTQTKIDIKANRDKTNRIIEITDEDIQDEVVAQPSTPPKSLIEHKDKKEKVISHVIDLGQIIKNMSDVAWAVIEAIGVKGYSEKNDIIQYIKSKIQDVSDASIDNALMELKTTNAIDRERISTGWRSFYVYELTDTGVRIFKESGKFEGEPVLCEKRRLIKQHATAQHGYGIKDVAMILSEELGYIDVSYDREKTQIELPNGDIYIPDVVGINPATGEKEYFEYELAHHTQVDFGEKCTKMRMVTNKLHFIVPTNIERRKIQNQLNMWLLSKGNPENIKTYVTTTRNLKKGKWDTDDLYETEKTDTSA